MTLSTMLPSLSTSIYIDTNKLTFRSSKLQVNLFFISLYLLAIGQGGHRPCAQAFGADQFDVEDPLMCRSKSSFFNWRYFGVCSSSFVSTLIMSYVQDNLSCGLGFGIPCVLMFIALGVFLLGTRTYRYRIKKEKSLFVRIGQVFLASIKNWRTTPSEIVIKEEFGRTLQEYQYCSDEFK